MSLSHFIKLNTGARMPALGYGTYLAKDDALATGLDYALHCGYRHIDTAFRYFNQGTIGQVLKDQISDGKIKREDVFVTTKIPGNQICGEGVKITLEESLEDLKLNNVDMLLLHTPFGYGLRDSVENLPDLVDTDIIHGWKCMEEMMNEGKTKAIGVSNFTRSQMDRICEKCKIEIANLQLECHPYLQQRELRKYCLQMGIAVTAYTPLGNPNRPAHHRNENEPPSMLDHPVVRDIADSMSKTPAQVILRYLLQLGVAPLAKSVTLSRIQENIDLFDFRLDRDQMNTVKTLDSGVKFFKFSFASKHKEYPHNEPF